MWVVFIILAPTVFLDVDIYKAFAQTTPFFAVLALALTFVVITGEIDLSFPSIMALGTAVFSLLVKADLPQWLALIGGFAGGALGSTCAASSSASAPPSSIAASSWC